MHRRQALQTGAVVAAAVSSGCLGRIERWRTDWTVEASWPTYRADSRHSNYVPDSPGPKGDDVLWKTTTVTDNSVQPVVADNMVFVGTRSGGVSAFHAPTGYTEWEMELDSTVSTTPALIDGTLVVSVDGQGVVGIDPEVGTQSWTISEPTTFREAGFAISADWGFVSGADGQVVAFDPDGSILWETMVTVDGNSDIQLTHLAEHDGTLFVGSEDGLHAMEADSGGHKWTYGQGRRALKGPAIDGETVYVSFDNGQETGDPESRLVALDAQSGEQLWSHSLDRRNPHAPATDGEYLYLGDSSPEQVIALDSESGSIQWTTSVGTPVNDAPTIATDTLLVPTLDGVLVLNRETGTRLRRIAPDANMPLFTSPCIVDEVAVFTTVSDKTYAIGGPGD